jgi:toxin ParE1/3/4
MPTVIYSPSALRDLGEIGYHVAKDNPSAADALLSRIERTCELIATRPEMGELRPEFASGRYRSFSVGNYVIYFCSVSDGLWVARVLHGARDHGPLL